MRHGRQHIKRFSPIRRHRGIGIGRHVQIEGEIVRHMLLVEDVREQVLVARTQDDVVMLQLGVGVPLLRPEIDHEERHAVSHPLHLPVGVFAPVFGFDQVQIGEGHVGVRHDRIGLHTLAGCQADTLRATVRNEDFSDLLLIMEAAAHVFNQLHQGVDDGARAAHRVMHTPLPLQIMDHRIDGRGVEGISAHQQRVEGETLPQEIILHESAHIAVHRLVRLQLDEVRRHAHHVHHLEEGLIGQFDETFLEDGLRGFDEIQIPLLVIRIPLLDLTQGEGLIAIVIEHAAFMIEDAVEGIAGDEGDVVFAFFAGQSEQIIEHERCGDNGRAAIEFVAVHLVHIAASAGLVAFFEQVDVVAFGQ